MYEVYWSETSQDQFLLDVLFENRFEAFISKLSHPECYAVCHVKYYCHM